VSTCEVGSSLTLTQSVLPKICQFVLAAGKCHNYIFFKNA
jgi:hypothetical protein